MKFYHFIVAMIILWLSDCFMIWYKERNAKKCNYDCSKCKNWDCFAPYCNKKRSSNEK